MEKKEKKFIATIFKRHDLGDDCSIMACDHISIGTVDEKTQIFKDEEENTYSPLSNPFVLTSQVPYMYDNIMPIEKLKEVARDNKLPFKIVLKEYEEMCKKTLFLVGKTENGQPFTTTINTDDIKIAAKRQSDQEMGIQSNNPEEDDDSLDLLVSEIVEGKYSISELENILSNLKETHDDIGKAIGIIKEQINEEKGLKPDTKEEIVEEKKQIDINNIFQNVKKTLIAQDEPALRVITEIARKEMDARKKREGILLTGATGVGKTELMRLIAKYMDVPFHRIDSTQLTMPGYVGRDIEEELWDLYEECGENVKKAESAIIFFDEVDKKGSSKRSDVSGLGVVNTLLRFIEGETYNACKDTKTSQRSVKIKTDNMTVILGGAFTDVYKKEVEKTQLGFLNENKAAKQNKISTKDFVEKGQMPQEFMGRVTVVKLNDLSANDLKRIMLESDESSTRIQQEIFEKLGVKITFTDDYITGVAENALNQQTGARGLNDVISDSTWKAFYEVQSNPGKYEEVIIDKESLHDEDAYQLIKKKNN